MRYPDTRRLQLLSATGKLPSIVGMTTTACLFKELSLLLRRTAALLWGPSCVVYLSADEVQAPAVSTHVDVLVARALQTKLVGVATGRLTVDLQPP